MAKSRTYVIVGASLAGAKAAEALRENGCSERIVLVGAEAEPPYERPALSKGYLSGKEDRATLAVHDERWYADNAVELLLGRRATRVDRAAHEVELDGGERIGYAKLLLTTGSSARRLHVPGGDLDGVHHLRRVEDSTRLREAIRGGGQVVVVGAGWIGLEVAAAARRYGCAVTVIQPSATPLRAALGPEMGGLFAQLHRRHGVDLRTGHGVTGLRGNGRVSAVVTDDGAETPADAVIVGIGARPDTELAEHAQLSVDNGIVVDESLRTEDPDIYAAGDVANSFHPWYGRRIRVEHWANALRGGPVAARAMLGQRVVHDGLPYFFTDQYELGMEFSGWFAPGGYDTVVTRGDLDGLAFHAFWLADNRVVAGMHVNQWDEGIAPIQDLIHSRQPVDPNRLADTATPLADHLTGRTVYSP
ncbi:MAG: NAD(P)/FAD-dependent oxidoreductase [Actinophytocola sp.]|uniref:NAD(P)/FAD-dependent oxidoreductase n=1 Tax=Actinophytocola sp. TaxID=1872138 RepID=UPI00132BA4F5|nr:FAD-dependent oxidoreductase [Actinophytocola sp.]MPZ78900.1 NAD(P)/FAD-dependent oxidoreductase [Actinophytocola sp.]